MPNWNDLAPDTPAIENAEIAGRWVPVLEALPGGLHLRITASGLWAALGGMLPDCGPDGLSGLPFESAQLIIADCPVGALIGKFGGSSATHKAAAPEATALAEDVPFAIGSYCVVKVPEIAPGALLIGFNIVYRPVKVTRLALQLAKQG